MKPYVKWACLIVVLIACFYWKLVFTRQFSILIWSEPANQAYSWYHFCAATVKQGMIPLWDPFSHAGRTFVGGMETGVFYPLKLILYLWPFTRDQLFSIQAFNYFYVFTHGLAAFFLFLLARELGLTPFPALVAGLCFSLGGFMAKIGWPDMLDSAIWLPLIFLFLTRAVRSRRVERALVYCAFAGLGLGMAVLGGRIHIVIMDGLVIVTGAVYLMLRNSRTDSGTGLPPFPWRRVIAIIALIALVGMAFGAVQLLPSIEYSRLAVRSIGAENAVQATHKIYYSDLRGELWPRSLFALLLVDPFPHDTVGGDGFNPYFGVLPFLLAVVGVWQNWQNVWVRYLAGLAVATFFYTLGAYSFLHGLLYALVPYLWIAREAGRFIYLAHFATAILAGFGVQTIFSAEVSARNRLAGFLPVLKWLAIISLVALGIPAFLDKPTINEWAYFSLLCIIASCGVLAYIVHGHATSAAGTVLVLVILFDLHGSYWFIRDINAAMKSGEDYLHTKLLPSRGVAEFLKSQNGLFRVHMDMDGPPNIGDLYGIQTTEFMGATTLPDFERLRSEVPRAYDMLNVRFVLKPSSAGEPEPVYSDAEWKVYENKSVCPRGWIVHQTVGASSIAQALHQMKDPGFDPLRCAVVSDALEEPLKPAESGIDEVRIESYGAQRLELTTRAQSQGLLVLSEMDYPGWVATVNGKPAPIHKADGVLRAVLVPAGQSRVVVRYAPASVLLGAITTGIAFFATVGFALFVRLRNSGAHYDA